MGKKKKKTNEDDGRVQLWPTDYDKMKIVPPTPDSTLVCPSDSLSVRINSSGFPFRVLSGADALGRRAVASTTLKAGTVLFQEQGVPVVIYNTHMKRVCHNCHTTLIGTRVLDGEGSSAAQINSSPHCNTCQQAFYCTNACMQQHEKVHKLECRALEEVNEISDVSLVNIDLARAVIKYIALKIQQTANQSETTSSSTSSSSSAPSIPLFSSSLADLSELVAHRSSVESADIQHMRDCAALTNKYFAEQHRVDTEEIVDFICRLNSNCHSLSLAGSAHVSFGFGLFPLCAIFNHSCLPNCVYVNGTLGGTLQFRVIRDTEQHEELTVNYISLYQSRSARRQDLYREKKFFCCCRRCMLRPSNEEEKKLIQYDQFIGGIACRKDKCTGFYRATYEKMISPFNNNKSTENNDNTNDDDKDDADGVDEKKLNDDVKEMKLSSDASSSSSSTTSASPDSSSPPPFPAPRLTSLCCSVCQHSPSPSALIAEQESKVEKSEELLEAYSTAIEMKKSAQTLRDDFERFIKEIQPLYHRHHFMFFNLYLPLVNLCSHLQDHKSKLEYINLVLEMSEHVFARHFSPVCNYLQAKIETLNMFIKKNALPKKLLQRHLTDLLSTYVRLIESMTIGLGEDNSQTIAVKKEYELAKNIKL